ncbi:MAG: cadmium-translocating P-type ATPase [Elusimicrobia bacterium]|nr:cadmium-translocating P-type ATPase [Elusimicrobiota bacterium]
MKKVVMPVEGIRCASCVARIEKALSLIPGVSEVSVHLPSKTAFIAYDGKISSAEKIKDAIEGAGYNVTAVSESSVETGNLALSGMEKEKEKFLYKFLSAFALTLLISADFWFDFSSYTLLALTTAVWGWCGSHFHAGMFKSLKAKTADMNTLVSVSSSTAYFYSIVTAFFPHAVHGHPQWHETVMLITFINLGRYMEARSKYKANQSVSTLLRAAPKFARRVVDGGDEMVPVERIKRGDLIILRPGEQIPVDGEVISGFSIIDESIFTGESIPAEKEAGSRIFAGTINKTGVLKFRADGVGEDMALMKIVRIMQESQSRKTSVQHLVDKISAYFAPVVFLTAMASFGFWIYHSGFDMAVTTFVSVLAIACPCAMGLSVPMAVAVGFGRAAEMGILINNPDVLERISGIDVLVMDKTGTITEGRLKISGVYPYEMDKDAFLEYLLTAEDKSEHPFAEAVRNYTGDKKVRPGETSSVQSVPGKGIIARTEGIEIAAGSFKWMRERNVQIDEAVAEKVKDSSASSLFLSVNGKFAGYIFLSDNIRNGAGEMMHNLEKSGIKPVLVSGDRLKIVEETAAALKIKDYFAEVFPEEKQAIVLKYKSEGKKVAMAGDGFNDAAALSEADIGIAMRSGTDIAVQASDITLMRNNLSAIIDAIKLSKAIRRVMIQNLVWAFVYNVVLIPMAAGVLYPTFKIIIPPYFAGAAMAMSSISVVMNSIRLRKMKI